MLPELDRSCTGTSTADPAVDADAAPAIAKDSPAIPNAGVALFTLFRFGLFVARAIGILHTLRSRPFTRLYAGRMNVT